MLKYILKRLLYMIPVLFGIIVFVFVLKVVTPGDPVDSLLPATATVEEKQELREQLGLDQPILVQFGNYIWGLVTRLDLGKSYTTRLPVTQELFSRFPKTIVIGLASLLVGQIIANPLGILAAVKQNTWVDSIIVFFTMVGSALPNFWLALMLITLFSVKLGWLPSMYDGTFASWIMPVICASFGAIAATARGVRTTMLEVIRQDYIRTARAKGASEVSVILNHGFRNTAIPVVAGMGSALGMLLGGSLIVESVFAVPGVGKFITDATTARNWPIVQGGTIILSAYNMLINLLVDVMYTVVDPRMKTTFVKSKQKKRVAARTAAAKGGN